MGYKIELQTQAGWSTVSVPIWPLGAPGAPSEAEQTAALQSYLANRPASWNGYTLRISRGGPPWWFPVVNTVAWWRSRTYGQLLSMFNVGAPPALAPPPPLPPRRYYPGLSVSNAGPTGTWRIGATPDAPVPDPAVEWTWQAQQAYATGLDTRLRELEGEVSQNQVGTAIVGGVAGLLAAGFVLLGVQLSRRGF